MYEDFLRNSLMLNALQTSLFEELNANICELKSIQEARENNTYTPMEFEEEAQINDEQFNFDFEDDFNF